MLSLDHVQLTIPAAGEDAARAFYGELLGLEELPKPPLLAARGGVWFRLGGLELHLGVEEPFAPARKAHPGMRLGSDAELRTLAGTLADAGLTVGWADPAEIPGRSRFHVSDPFGNRLEFLA